MRDLEILLEECKKECDAQSIKYGIVLNIMVNKNFKTTWGRCKTVYRENMRETKKFIIEISSKLMEESVDIKSLKDTITHELLHTVDGCFNHGDLWQFYANQMNNSYGYNIKRLNSKEDKGIETKADDYKYAFMCDSCSLIHGRYKMCNFVKNNYLYRCKCGGKLKQIK